MRAAAFRGITPFCNSVNHAHGFANCFISVCTASSIAIRARLRHVRIASSVDCALTNQRLLVTFQCLLVICIFVFSFQLSFQTNRKGRWE